LDGATVIGGDHHLHLLVLREVDEAGVMDHKEVGRTVLEWLAVKVAVDVVLNLGAA
jgi:hypothetical protein